MTNKRRPNIAGRALIAEARAGLVFACDHVEAELLAATSRIGRTVTDYAKVSKLASGDRAITDILVDLRHYCDSKELLFDELNAAAAQRYENEKADLV